MSLKTIDNIEYPSSKICNPRIYFPIFFCFWNTSAERGVGDRTLLLLITLSLSIT
jgi:hypothetical protein